MQVVPVCECPKCHKLGLHYMAKTFTDTKVSVEKWAELIKVPSEVLWYDERDSSPTELKVKYVYKETAFHTEQIVRECFYCSHVFYQDWKEWYECTTNL